VYAVAPDDEVPEIEPDTEVSSAGSPVPATVVVGVLLAALIVQSHPAALEVAVRFSGNEIIGSPLLSSIASVSEPDNVHCVDPPVWRAAAHAAAGEPVNDNVVASTPGDKATSVPETVSDEPFI